jgi:hypothetical protein
MLRRMDSREISEWMAFFQWKENPPAAPAPAIAPEEHAAQLKAALFKGK